MGLPTEPALVQLPGILILLGPSSADFRPQPPAREPMPTPEPWSILADQAASKVGRWHPADAAFPAGETPALPGGPTFEAACLADVAGHLQVSEDTVLRWIARPPYLLDALSLGHALDRPVLPEAYANDPCASPGGILTEILEFREASEGLQDAQAILYFLRENLNVEWKTFAQLNYRLNWLRALGKASKAPEGWSAA